LVRKEFKGLINNYRIERNDDLESIIYSRLHYAVMDKIYHMIIEENYDNYDEIKKIILSDIREMLKEEVEYGYIKLNDEKRIIDLPI
jgi:translation elongation factor P/translation initiation factor 5A